ncbi:T9SS type A sorting domain-containing protein [Pontibacter russatus]|uniref:T9SS type A sorting domain-containing protein n=1 Tax=Pontibacter russatus TaxID=2694929 RepID=UPI001379B285|nr:T9SS type A sorting domain-containing protein [Pontibacter russatus]
MKRILFFLVATLSFSTLSFAQVAPNFDIYAFPSRFDEKSEAYFDANGFDIRNVEVMTEGTIVSTYDHNDIDPQSIKRWLDKFFPGSTSSGKVVLDWESGPYMDMRNYPKSHSRFKAAEAKIIELITLVKRYRPNIDVSLYSFPFRTWNDWQQDNYNTPGKLDNVISKLDFITPSLYILYTDEEVGRERNLKYLRDNMDPALIYGKKYNKPVIPFVWHRVHFNSPLYGKQIMRKETLARYIKYVMNYSYNNYEPEGITWWDGVGGRLDNLGGMDGFLNGTVYNAETYDAMIVSFAKYIKQELNEGAVAAPAPSSDAQKVVSYTLFNADTKQEIKTLSNGAVLDLSTLPTKNLDIRANTSPATVGSVVFSLSGAASKSVIENISTYDMMGDQGAWVPAEGSYTLKATPYTAYGGSGTAGTSLSISFKVVKDASSSSSSDITLTLVNASNESDIMALTDGATLDLSKLPTKSLNVRANTVSSSVESVVLQLSGEETYKRTESGAPYTLRGDENGDYYGWTPASGSYTLKVISYSGAKGTGTVLNTVSVSFKVVTGLSTSSSSSATAGSEVAPLADGLSAYPNPASAMLNVEFGDTGEGVAKINLLDFNGNVVLTQEEQTSASGFRTALDVSSLKSGLYVLQVVTPKGRTSQRVVIE